MFFWGGKDRREQITNEFPTAYKFLEIAVRQRKVERFFHHFQIQRIAIAPYCRFGIYLAELLKDSGVKVTCFMDKMYLQYSENNERPCSWIEIESYEGAGEKDADAIVIASNYYRNDIIDTLVENDVPLEKMIGIDSVLYGLEGIEET